MRCNERMMVAFGVLAIGLSARLASVQPGHAPFVFAPLEIEDYERTLVAPGVAALRSSIPASFPVAPIQPSLPTVTSLPMCKPVRPSSSIEFNPRGSNSAASSATPLPKARSPEATTTISFPAEPPSRPADIPMGVPTVTSRCWRVTPRIRTTTEPNSAS